MKDRIQSVPLSHIVRWCVCTISTTHTMTVQIPVLALAIPHTHFAAPLRGEMVGCVCSFYGSIEV